MDNSVSSEDLLSNFISGNSTSNPNDIGKLQSNIAASIHTKHAATLIQGKVIDDGKNSRGVIGLYKFASMAAKLEENIKKDDPFADYIFYSLHEEIILARNELSEKVEHFKNWMKGKIPKTMILSESLNIQPLRMDFKFNSTLAFQLAYLILDCDELFRLVKLAQHIALMDSSQANESINDKMRNVRRIMNLIYLYKHSNVTRNDFVNKNKVWERACELMPNIIVPDHILSGEKRSQLAPYIAERPENQKIENVKIPEAVE